MMAERTSLGLFKLLAYVVLLGLTGCASDVSVYSIFDMKVNGMFNPEGLDENPVFQWRLSSSEKGVVQVAYEIEVSDDQNNVIWKTGVVDSSASYGIAYTGVPLKSGVRYTWQISSYNNRGDKSISDKQSFRMGMINLSAWNASWIEATYMRKPKKEISNPFAFENGQSDASTPEETLDPPLYFRKTFALDKPVEEIRQATIYATAHGIYDLYVNGKRISEELAPGFTTYKDQLEYQQYDITKKIKQRDNAIAVVLADGWWSGTWGIVGVGEQYGNTNALLCQLEVEYIDGSRQYVVSDHSWKWNKGGYIYADISEGVCFDESKEPYGWMSEEYDDSGWKEVRIADYGYDNLCGRRSEPVRVIRTIPARKLIYTPKGETVIDFGENIVGRVRAVLSGEKGQRIELLHSEVLDEKGNFFQNIQGAYKAQRDVYIFAGNKKVTFVSRFTFHGFRYVKITGASNIKVTDFTAEVMATDMEVTGCFTCSDETLTKLQQNIFRSQQGNMLSIPTDCPHREKAGWTGDMQIYASTAVYNMDVYAFLRRWLAGLRADQYEDGAVPDISPRPSDAAMLFPSRCSAGWGDACIIVPYRLYQEYGQIEILQENYDMMTCWMDYIAGRVAAGQWTKDFHYGDWMAPNPSQNKVDTIFNPVAAAALSGGGMADAMYAYVIQLMVKIASLLDNNEDVDKYTELLPRVRNEFVRKYIAEDGTIRPALQGLYVLALATGVVPEEKKALVARKLVEDIQRMDYHLNVGFPSVPFILDVLCDNGYEDVAWKVLMQDSSPSWLYEVKMGATTVWEKWNGISSDGKPQYTSYNHFAFGCVGDFLYRRVLGLKAIRPAYAEFEVRPWWDCGLSWAKGKHLTPYGEISVSWEKEGDVRNLDVQVPPGAKAILYIHDEPVKVESGCYHFES